MGTGGVEYVYNYWFEAYNSANAPAGGVDLKKTTLTIIGSNASGGLGNAHPYPSFARLSNGDKISFVGLTPNAELKIFTPAGNLVQTLQADSSGVVPPWDGTVDGGGRAVSGTYIIRVSDGNGDKKTFKVLIVR